MYYLTSLYITFLVRKRFLLSILLPTPHNTSFFETTYSSSSPEYLQHEERQYLSVNFILLFPLHIF